jgi:RNA polymerase sigma factor (sigma-70 family)
VVGKAAVDDGSRGRVMKRDTRPVTIEEQEPTIGFSEAEAKRGQRALTLHNSAPVDPSTVAGEVGGDDKGFERAETRTVVRDLLAALPRLERDMVHAYYLEGRTQAEIAHQLGRSQMFVSRHLERSLEILRTRVVHKWPVPPAHAASPTTRDGLRLSASHAS